MRHSPVVLAAAKVLSEVAVAANKMSAVHWQIDPPLSCYVHSGAVQQLVTGPDALLRVSIDSCCVGQTNTFHLIVVWTFSSSHFRDRFRTPKLTKFIIFELLRLEPSFRYGLKVFWRCSVKTLFKIQIIDTYFTLAHPPNTFLYLQNVYHCEAQG